MRPIIVVSSDKDGKIVLTKEELEKYIFEAYEAGKNDANIYAPQLPYNPFSSGGGIIYKNTSGSVDVKLKEA